jgi:nucleoside-diphosphate-sugar epimerase
MRILVTGVTGQVGERLWPRLQGSGTVLAADRSRPSTWPGRTR